MKFANELITDIELAGFMARRKNKQTFLTNRPKHLRHKGWWYTGAAIPGYPGKIYGIAVAGFYTIRKGRRYYSYIINIDGDKGLRRAEFPL